MSKSILDLPTEISDYIFGYLPVKDQKNARLVCSQWNQQLSSPRYYKNTKLRLVHHVNKDLLRAARKGKIHCIEASLWASSDSEKYDVPVVQLLERCRFSLEKFSLRLFPRTELAINAIFDALGKMLRLRHLSLVYQTFYQTIGASAPKVPSIISASAGFTLITHLEVDLLNESFVELVRSLAKQLTCLVLSVNCENCENLLVRCLNEPHLSVLHSLTVESASQSAQATNCIGLGELGDGCWRMLAQLESLRCSEAPLLDLVLPEMFRHCQKLKCLAIDQWQLYRNVDQINSFKGLKELSLYNFRPRDNLSKDLPTLSNLFDLDHLYLSTAIRIRLGHLPKLTSVVIASPPTSYYAKAKGLLWQIKNIDGIQGRRFRKLHFKYMHVHRQAIDLIGSLSIDVLSFEDCLIDASLLDFLVETETRRTILKILTDDCIIMKKKEKSYNVRTIPELRAKCPRLQIAVDGIHVEAFYDDNVDDDGHFYYYYYYYYDSYDTNDDYDGRNSDGSDY